MKSYASLKKTLLKWQMRRLVNSFLTSSHDQKKDCRYRIILDLSELNECIEYHHFKMDTLNTVVDLITPGCYMASIDLKDAYYTVPIAESHRNFLKFRWGRSLWQFKALPNCLSARSCLFTKLLKPPLATLRARALNCCMYWWYPNCRWNC